MDEPGFNLAELTLSRLQRSQTVAKRTYELLDQAIATIRAARRNRTARVAEFSDSAPATFPTPSAPPAPPDAAQPITGVRPPSGITETASTG